MRRRVLVAPFIPGPNNSGPAGGSAPAWFTSQTEKTWTTINSNTVASVAASPSPGGNGIQGVFDGWTGGALDPATGEYFLCANGGHSDYSGNETYMLNVTDTSPTWVRMTNPSTATGGDQTQNGLGTYADGLMCALHTCTKPVWAKGRIWFPGIWGMPSTNWSTAVWSWNRGAISPPWPAASNPFTYHGKGVSDANLSGLSYSNQYGMGLYDPIGEDLWGLADYADSYGLFKVNISDVNSPVITAYPQGWANLVDAWGVCVADDASNRWLIVGAPDVAEVRIWNLNNVAAGYVANATTNGPGGINGFSGTPAAVYDPVSRKIYCHAHEWGAEIRTLTVPTNPYTAGTASWQWATVTNNGGGATPPGTVTGAPNPYPGVYKKFQFMPDMGNGQGCLFASHNHNGSVYAYKLPVGGL